MSVAFRCARKTPPPHFAIHMRMPTSKHAILGGVDVVAKPLWLCTLHRWGECVCLCDGHQRCYTTNGAGMCCIAEVRSLASSLGWFVNDCVSSDKHVELCASSHLCQHMYEWKLVINILNSDKLYVYSSIKCVSILLLYRYGSHVRYWQYLRFELFAFIMFLNINVAELLLVFRVFVFCIQELTFRVECRMNVKLYVYVFYIRVTIDVVDFDFWLFSENVINSCGCFFYKYMYNIQFEFSCIPIGDVVFL